MNALSPSQRNLTRQIFQDGGQIDRCSNTNAVLRKTPFDVAQHASYRKDDPGLGGPGRLGRLLLSSSAGHLADNVSMSGSEVGHRDSVKTACFMVSKLSLPSVIYSLFQWLTTISHMTLSSFSYSYVLKKNGRFKISSSKICIWLGRTHALSHRAVAVFTYTKTRDSNDRNARNVCGAYILMLPVWFLSTLFNGKNSIGLNTSFHNSCKWIH